MTVVEDLEFGLARLRANGWTQGTYVSGATGRCCAVGALYRQHVDTDSLSWLALATGEDNPQGPAFNEGVVVGWNDTEGRTFEEVEALYLRAIELAKENSLVKAVGSVDHPG